MRIYMDVCCLGRPFDDLTQGRVYLEAEAVLSNAKIRVANPVTWLMEVTNDE